MCAKPLKVGSFRPGQSTGTMRGRARPPTLDEVAAGRSEQADAPGAAHDRPERMAGGSRARRRLAYPQLHARVRRVARRRYAAGRIEMADHRRDPVRAAARGASRAAGQGPRRHDPRRFPAFSWPMRTTTLRGRWRGGSRMRSGGMHDPRRLAMHVLRDVGPLRRSALSVRPVRARSAPTALAWITATSTT